MTSTRPLLAGVELGGTKCICILGTGPDDIRERVRVPTDAPDATLTQIGSVLERWDAEHGAVAALGIASFGPLDLRPGSATYGHVTSTAKAGWRGVDVVGRLTAQRRIPVGFNTDVNGAAVAEGLWGAAQGLADFAYVTVGTGIGVGLVVAGKLIRGCNHTELGHIRIARVPGDAWPGICSYHGDCVEGLASGPAIASRAGMSAAAVVPDSPVWDFVTHALAQLLHTLVFATAPQRILIGGGVAAARPELLARLRQRLLESINDFIDLEDLTGGTLHYVVPPGLGALAGPLGALALAAEAQASAGTTPAARSSRSVRPV